jgi:hypothetical protein
VMKAKTKKRLSKNKWDLACLARPHNAFHFDN